MRPNDQMPMGPISYHMSYTLLAMTNAAGGPIRMRLTLLGELLSDVAAKASALKGTAHDELTTALEEVEKDLEFLERQYEPILDYNIHTYGKSGEYDVAMREIRTTLAGLIEQYNLCSKEDIEGAAMPSPAIRRRGE
ncbi:MAG: hypothetical protein WC277_10875 [Bacilli bacterium]